MSATAIQDESLVGNTRKATMLYDDLDSGSAAKALLDRATRSAGQEFEWRVRPWRFDALLSSALADEAQREAADADLILMAAHRCRALPAAVMEWLEQWAVRRTASDAAVAVLWCTGSEQASAAPAEGALRELAGRYGLHFVSGFEPTPGWDQAEPGEVPGYAGQFTSSTPGEIPELPWQTSDYHHWGLNE